MEIPITIILSKAILDSSKKILKWWVTGTVNGEPVAYESERHARLFMRNHWKNKQRRLGKIQKISIKNLDKYLDK